MQSNAFGRLIHRARTRNGRPPRSSQQPSVSKIDSLVFRKAIPARFRGAAKGRSFASDATPFGSKICYVGTVSLRKAPEGKRARNRAERTEAIVSAAKGLFVEHGVEAVTIDDIAKASGMAKGNFYRYFNDKRHLVDAIVAPIARDVRRAMRRGAIAIAKAKNHDEMNAAYGSMAIAIAGSLLPRLDIAQLYLQENRAPTTPARAGLQSFSRELRNGAIKMTELAVRQGLLKVDDPRVSAIAVIGAVEQLALTVMQGDLDTPPQTIVQIMVKLVLEGIAGTAPN